MFPIWLARFRGGEQHDMTGVSIAAPGSRSSRGFTLALASVMPFPGYTPEGISFVALAIGSELADALAFPPWTGTVLKFAGLCTLLIGTMAWLTARGIHRRGWGRRVALSGATLTVVGFAFDTFVEVLKYVLSG